MGCGDEFGAPTGNSNFRISLVYILKTYRTAQETQHLQNNFGSTLRDCEEMILSVAIDGVETVTVWRPLGLSQCLI